MHNSTAASPASSTSASTPSIFCVFARETVKLLLTNLKSKISAHRLYGNTHTGNQ
jgi:hypothetical protein